MNPRHVLQIGIAAVALITSMGWALPSIAADGAAYPNRPVRMVVPFPPGGTADNIARLVAQGISATLKQPVVVDNRAGATGLIGTQSVQHAEPDGYTLLFTSSSAHITGALTRATVPFDPVRDFAPIGKIVQYPIYVVANPSLPAKTLAEVIAYAKQRPDQIMYSSVGVGSVGNLSCEMFAIAAGIRIAHVPYKGTAPATQALLSNETQLMCDTIAGSQPYVADGRMRGLVLMGKSRSPQAPDIPTTAEAGLRDAEAYVWLGLFAPKGTPSPVVGTLSKALRTYLASPEFQERAQKLAMEVVNDDPKRFADAIRSDKSAWAKVIEAKGIKAE